jgi:hypothetical protein
MRRINLSILILILSVFSHHLWGGDLTPQEFEKKFFKKQLVEIDEVVVDPTLAVDESRIYLVDKYHCMIYIFDIKSGKKINAIGRKGEGPGEFRYISKLDIKDDLIYVSSPPKISIFSRDGKFLKEKRTYVVGAEVGGAFTPFVNNYIFTKFFYDLKEHPYKVYICYLLLDKDLKEIKEIFRAPFNIPWKKDINKKPLRIFHDCRKEILYKERFYIGNTELGFYFAVFDIKGNKLYEIKKEYDKIPVTEEIKQKFFNFHKALNPEEFNKMLTHREVHFPKYIPAFVNFFIDNDKIFIFKYPKPGAKGWFELIILDLSGNIIGQKMLPLGYFYNYLENTGSISFYKEKIYFIINLEESTSFGEFSLDEVVKYYFKK